MKKFLYCLVVLFTQETLVIANETKIVEEGDLIPQSGGETFDRVEGVVFNDKGEVLFFGENKSSTHSGIYVKRGQGIQRLVDTTMQTIDGIKINHVQYSFYVDGENIYFNSAGNIFRISGDRIERIVKSDEIEAPGDKAVSRCTLQSISLCIAYSSDRESLGLYSFTDTSIKLELSPNPQKFGDFVRAVNLKHGILVETLLEDRYETKLWLLTKGNVSLVLPAPSTIKTVSKGRAVLSYLKRTGTTVKEFYFFDGKTKQSIVQTGAIVPGMGALISLWDARTDGESVAFGARWEGNVNVFWSQGRLTRLPGVIGYYPEVAAVSGTKVALKFYKNGNETFYDSISLVNAK